MVRNLEKRDLPQLAELYRQFWGEPSDVAGMERQFELMQRENTHIILVYEAEGKVVGSVMGVVCRELYGDCRPFLTVENMIVDKHHRRAGVGRSLLSALEDAARGRDCTQMILVTEKNRADACGFYEKYGFQTDTTGYKKKLQRG
ncbi:MAG: GNAT family N-acetyltransferase [Ruminococcaceae bacterium]|nr:GNAT family N-acetyltransferase [Oscillospiraceae bacterium]